MQRSILRRLVEQPDGPLAGSAQGEGGDLRGAAIFALAYWAGCSVGEISSLLASDVHLGGEVAWLHIGSARGASRSIPLREKVRIALANYLGSAARCQASVYLFTSQRERVPVPVTELGGWRLGEAALSRSSISGTISSSGQRRPPDVLRLFLGYPSRRGATAGQKQLVVT
jgi:integrase